MPYKIIFYEAIDNLEKRRAAEGLGRGLEGKPIALLARAQKERRLGTLSSLRFPSRPRSSTSTQVETQRFPLNAPQHVESIGYLMLVPCQVPRRSLYRPALMRKRQRCAASNQFCQGSDQESRTGGLDWD